MHDFQRALVEAVATGDREASLRALRDVLARAIAGADGFPIAARELAALSRQLREVIEELASLVVPEIKGTPLDDLARRRLEVSAADASASTRRRSV